MKWIVYLLLLAILAYMALNLSGQEAGRSSPTGNASIGELKSLSAEDSGFGNKDVKILFLSEAEKIGDKPGEEVVLKQPTLVATADELRSCEGLGPFENIISVQSVAQRLRAIGYTVEMTAVDTQTGESDYRVVMPPLNSQQEAFRRFRELKSRGIDSFVITKGVSARGISLGVFSSSGAADDYRQSLMGLGYKVLVDVIPRVNRGYWVQIREGMFPEELLLKVAAEFIEVEVTETGCMN